ncbi:NADH dehydrogenase [ubiquinone] 1 alpha subcomplex subunit 7-like [Leptopilina boulardi]|uniref:NADH dehydrogenase [ubiquinone] 1 alpha subcomplex subunit 7-like n=1 Tax=Leptopilina boulardi TaxID=63433 RepID=UPI0021F53DDD|nr:NADH dehydrogenase [ubiquinone] 1 alpha subcomplex subunit 7-like [Leptopilina boulardi]
MGRVVEHRTVTPIIDGIRVILRGRQHRNALRYADDQAARTQPPPDLPGGPFHKTSKIYYFTRDARREVEPPLVISSATVKQITAGEQEKATKALTPGKAYLPA